MKKAIKLTFCIALVIAALFGFSAVANAQDVSVTLDGQSLTFDQAPVIDNGRTLVPLRGIFEAMGASVEWDGSAQKVTAAKDGITVELTIGDNVLYKNGEAVTLDVPAQIVNSRTMVPARAISESFGARVDWNGTDANVIISTDGILNGALGKLELINEIIVEADVELSYSIFTVPMNMKIGLDYVNQKMFFDYGIDVLFNTVKITMVNGEGKTYIDMNGTTSVEEAATLMADVPRDGLVFVYDSDDGNERVYSINVKTDAGPISFRVRADKDSQSFTTLVIPKEIMNLFMGDILEVEEDIECKISHNTGEVVEMWNKYNQ